MRRLSSSRRQGARVALLLQLLQLLHHLSVAQKRNKQSRATIKQSGKQASKQSGRQAVMQSGDQAIRHDDGLFSASSNAPQGSEERGLGISHSLSLNNM